MPRSRDRERDTRRLDVRKEPVARAIEARARPFVAALVPSERHAARPRIRAEPAHAEIDEVRRERENLPASAPAIVDAAERPAPSADELPRDPDPAVQAEARAFLRELGVPLGASEGR